METSPVPGEYRKLRAIKFASSNKTIRDQFGRFEFGSAGNCSFSLTIDEEVMAYAEFGVTGFFDQAQRSAWKMT